MTFKQTATLGLSALILSSTSLLPYAQATTMVMNSQPNAQQQLSQMVDNHMLLDLARQQNLLHPKHHSFNMLGLLNPMTLLFHKHAQPVHIAKTLPIQKAPIQAMAATPVHTTSLAATQPAKPTTKPMASHPTKPTKAMATIPKSAIKVAAQPMKPVITANPAIEPQAAPLHTSISSKDVQPIQADAASKPATQQADMATTMPTAEASTTTQSTTTPKQNPTFQRIYQTQDPNERMIAKKRDADETFQMLATSPLDKLVLQSRGMSYTPGLDTSSQDSGMMGGDGGVKVLKSGISQKVTNVDISLGKAEVLYLSRPASRVSVSNPDVATAVIISPTQIQLVGKAVGVANLLVWGDLVSPDHTVVDISVHRDVSVLVNQLKYVDPGIQIVPMAAEDTVILTGQAENRESAQLAIEMAKAFFSKGGGASMAGASPTPTGPNSQAPGSATPGLATNVINLIKVKGEPSTKVELVRQRLQEIDPNIRIDVVPGPDGNEKVILTGRVASSSIASKALNLASVFYGQPGLKLVTAQGGNEFARMQVSGGSDNSGSSSGSSGSSGGGGATTTGGVNLLQGSILTDATGNVISMLEVAQKPQIRCSIKFLELNKTSLNALGGTLTGVRGATKWANWSGVQSPAPGRAIAQLDTQSPPGSSWSTTSGRGTVGNGWIPSSQTFFQTFREVYQNGITQAFTINNTVAGAIQALQERHQVRTLAEPTLTMLSGEQGSFLAGGEVPIAFVGGQGQVSIEYHEFGIRLNMLPTVTDDGKIQMQLSPEVSAIDQANGVSTNSINVPAFTSRKMNTTLIVEPGQSFVLAGLYNQQDTDSISRFPALGSVPVLGSFFRNKWKNKTGTEMVVLIKPEIIYSQTGSTTSQTSEVPDTRTQLSKK
jgi:Flp pilus assembly secretin CpaC